MRPTRAAHSCARGAARRDRGVHGAGAHGRSRCCVLAACNATAQPLRNATPEALRPRCTAARIISAALIPSAADAAWLAARSNFIMKHYKALKGANPTLPVLIRECAGAEARLTARFGASPSGVAQAVCPLR